jgi:hypothetical protein
LRLLLASEPADGRQDRAGDRRRHHLVPVLPSTGTEFLDSPDDGREEWSYC